MNDEKIQSKPTKPMPATKKVEGGDQVSKPKSAPKLKLDWLAIGAEVEGILGAENVSRIRLTRMVLPVVKKRIVSPLLAAFSGKE